MTTAQRRQARREWVQRELDRFGVSIYETPAGHTRIIGVLGDDLTVIDLADVTPFELTMLTRIKT